MLPRGDARGLFRGEPPARAMRGHASLGTAAVLLVLVTSLALAGRPPVQPIPNDSPFHARYDVVGRVVDAQGWPANQMTLEVGLDGLDGVRVEPVRVATNCYGDFGAVFDLGTIAGHAPEARVTVMAAQSLDERPFNVTSVVATGPLDRYHRLTQLTLRLAEPWPSECGEARAHWPGRVTLWGRAVHGVPEHSRGATAGLFSEPIANETVRAVERLSTGGVYRDDSLVASDARGDLKYSWTNALAVSEANVTVEVRGAWGNATMDPFTRVAFVKLATGAPPPLDAERAERPRADLALVAVAAIAGVAIVAVARKK